MLAFRLWTIFYVFAIVAAAMATFGPGGIFAAGIVLVFWGWMIYGRKWRLRLWQLLVAVLVFATMWPLLMPATQSAREAARRAQCANNLKQIALALLNYESAKRAFPPAYQTDANGKPIHSWRVLILPFIGQQALYSKYKFNEAWDGPNNSKLAARIGELYRCPSQADDKTDGPTETNYFVVVAPETIFPGTAGRTIRTITDGISSTIMVIEASGLGVNWMEPRDLTLDEAVEVLTTKPRSGHRHVSDGLLSTTYYETSERNVAYCNGRVLWMEQLSDAAIARSLLTAAGNEPTPAKLAEKFLEAKATTVIKVIKWGKVWGLSVFVVLSLLPVAWVGRRREIIADSAQPENDGAGEQAAGVAVDAKGAI